jgi:hypothetical protein
MQHWWAWSLIQYKKLFSLRLWSQRLLQMQGEAGHPGWQGVGQQKNNWKKEGRGGVQGYADPPPPAPPPQKKLATNENLLPTILSSPIKLGGGFCRLQ